MVTTRSADKRLDASREEDLVLRSRRINSPSSTTSTPSQSQKRAATTRGNVGSPRPKRARFGQDVASHDTASEIVVKVPPRPTRLEGEFAADASTDDSRHEASSTPTTTHDTDTADQATPTAKLAIVSQTPDTSGETFQTPATSRHKRFDSEEIDDDTIIVGAVIDSSNPQGYQTADEEIADSDDDEAPEVETAKLAPRLPQRRSARTPKAKKLSETVPQNVSVDEETIDTTASQTETESLTIRNESPVSVIGFSEMTQESVDATSSGSHQAWTDPTNSALSSAGAAPTLSWNQGFIPLVDATAELSNGVLVPARNNSFHHVFSQSRATQGQGNSLTPKANPVRLPAKATSSLSDYRRNKLQQKVARSAGGFKLQTTWPTKRSSFVAS